MSLATAASMHGEDAKPAPPRITAVAPLQLVPGAATTLRIRGIALDGATEVRLGRGESATVTAEIKEKKKADIPAGLEAKDIGDTQVEASLTVPADLAIGNVTLTVTTPNSAAPPIELRVIDPATLTEEKEPNAGFRQAQPIECGRLIRGGVKEDKDVDVYSVGTVEKRRYTVEIMAQRAPSLLDPIVSVYDASGHSLASSDDAIERDAQLTFTAPVTAACFIVVQDASDHGGAWSNYELLVKEAP